MDIYAYLKKDHKKVSVLFKKIIATKSSKIREQLFLEVKKELELHADPENDTFYKAISKQNQGENDAKHGEKEHKEIKKALAKLSKISHKDTIKWLVQFGELKHIVEHHVEDEEGKMFSDAKKILSHEESVNLATKMDELKKKKQSSATFLKQFATQKPRSKKAKAKKSRKK